MNPALVTTGPEFGLDLGRSISAVGEHIIAGVALVQQPIQLLAVVHGCIGHRIMSDQLVPGVRVHMVLVAEEAATRVSNAISKDSLLSPQPMLRFRSSPVTSIRTPTTERRDCAPPPMRPVESAHAVNLQFAQS